MDRAQIIAEACALLGVGAFGAAQDIITDKYPPGELTTPRGKWSEARLLRVFLRDGFTDRYFGVRLIFPGTRRMLSVLMPTEFPFHPNWKQDVTHPAFWELYPSINHVIPVARGGADDESNVVTTSMARNGAKANWLLEELGWPDNLAEVAGNWDGMLGWFLSQWNANEALHENVYLCKWHRAAVQLC